MELSGKTVHGPVLKTTQLSARAQNHASPERCRKSLTIIFLGDHNFPLTGSNFGNLTACRAIFSHIVVAWFHNPLPDTLHLLLVGLFVYACVLGRVYDCLPGCVYLC